MLEVILATAPGLATREGTLVVALAGVDAHMASEVSGGGEWAGASLADVLLLYFVDDGVWAFGDGVDARAEHGGGVEGGGRWDWALEGRFVGETW